MAKRKSEAGFTIKKKTRRPPRCSAYSLTKPLWFSMLRLPPSICTKLPSPSGAPFARSPPRTMLGPGGSVEGASAGSHPRPPSSCPAMSSRCGAGCARARGAALEGGGGGSRGCCFYLLRFVYEKRISAWLPTIYSGKGAPPEILLLPSQRADTARLPSAFSPPAGAAGTCDPGGATDCWGSCRLSPSLPLTAGRRGWVVKQPGAAGRRTKPTLLNHLPKGCSSSGTEGPTGFAFGVPRRL